MKKIFLAAVMVLLTGVLIISCDENMSVPGKRT